MKKNPIEQLRFLQGELDQDLLDSDAYSKEEIQALIRQEGPRPKVIPFQQFFGFAAAAAVILVTASVLWTFTTNEPIDHLKLSHNNVEDDKVRLKRKGNFDNIFVVAQRGARQFKLKEGDRLIQGDQLGFFYSTDEPGYLAVFALTEDSEVTLLFPAGKKSSDPITVGNQVPIPDGAVIDQGKGCEWILGVFSDTPLDTDPMIGVFKNASRGKNCELVVPEISDTRSIRVFPVGF